MGPAAFQIGDIARHKRYHEESGPITSISEDGDFFRLNGNTTGWTASALVLITPAKPTFKIGDKIKATKGESVLFGEVIACRPRGLSVLASGEGGLQNSTHFLEFDGWKIEAVAPTSAEVLAGFQIGQVFKHAYGTGLRIKYVKIGTDSFVEVNGRTVGAGNNAWLYVATNFYVGHGGELTAVDA